MAIKLLDQRGTPLDRQKFTWKDLVQPPISKLDDDAFTRIRTVLMNGVESEAIRFNHMCFRFEKDLRLLMSKIRRIEQHQQTLVNWLLPADQSPLETTIAYEQVAIEVTAALARKEPDPYVAQAFRFGLLEDFDHLYRYSALLDRMEGKDANNILQGYTDIIPGRPTAEEHRAPEDDIRTPYDRETAAPLTKLHTLTLVSGEYQTHDYYMHVGPLFPDPAARMLYAEIASMEEQHITHYGSLLDPTETPLEQWLLHEANEVYNYYSCVESETNPRLKAIWERFLDYEIGHFQAVREAFESKEGRDAAEVLPESLPEPIEYTSHRDYVLEVLEEEVDLRANGPEFVPKAKEPKRSKDYRNQMNSEGSPSSIISAGYQWMPGTELARRAAS